MSQETILVVDDDRNIRLLLKDLLLGPLGYHVICATDGREGLEFVRQHNPDLILLDMNMPNMTGVEMLQALRGTEFSTPVIFMTVEESVQVAVEVFRLGVRDYLIKPFSVDKIEAAIDRALASKRLEKERQMVNENLLKGETIRQTVVTLSHYLNNDLMSLQYGLDGIKEQAWPDLSVQLDACFDRLNHIKAVIQVLGKVTDVKHAIYHGAAAMIDIDAALKKVLSSGMKK